MWMLCSWRTSNILVCGSSIARTLFNSIIVVVHMFENLERSKLQSYENMARIFELCGNHNTERRFIILFR